MIRYGILKTACLLAATFLVTACTDDVADGTALPPGEYPMTFATAMGGLTQTGTTTDNTWAGNERIAVKVGDEVKEYKPASNNSFTLTAVDAANPFYWQKAEETVSAWYSGANYTAQLSSFSIKTDQSTDKGYRQSDFLYAKPQDITYSSRTTHQLTFEHLPAKVIVHLKNGNGVTAEEVEGATVRIVNQATTSGTIDATAGTVEQTTPGSKEIAPNALATSLNYQQSVQALVVPQQMAGKDFVKITIGTGATARNFYYVPVGENDANLLSGKQYTYNITVNKTELNVEIVSGTWNDKNFDDAMKGNFQIYLPEFTVPQNTENFMVTDAEGAPLTATNGMYKTSNSISISLSSSNGYILNKYLVKVAAGICKQRVSYIADTRTYTYTFYDFRSDLWIGSIEAEAKIPSALPPAQVGDFYYVDGTWSTEFLQKPCIGIVFKIGVGEKDAPTNYEGKLNKIHGYVVALTDANENAGAWGIREIDVAGVTNESDYVYKYDGYSNTAIVRELNAYNNTNVGTPIANGQYWAFKVASEYNNTAPATSSGWYLPSIGQLSDIYKLQNRSQLLNVAGGDDFETVENNGRYWSSTERHSADAWYYQFNSAGVDAFAKSNDGGSYLRPSYVRAVLTF